MALTASQFKNNFPEFATQSDSRVDAFLAQSLRRMSVDVFGALADDAQGYLTAHLLSRAAQAVVFANGASGAVVSESVGSVSRTYAAYLSTSATGASDLVTTFYGEQYLALLRQVSLGIDLAW